MSTEKSLAETRIPSRMICTYKTKNRRKNMPDLAFPRTLRILRFFTSPELMLLPADLLVHFQQCLYAQGPSGHLICFVFSLIYLIDVT